MNLPPTWFFEDGSKRKGPVTDEEMVELINMGKVTYGTPIWKAGLPTWISAEQTEFAANIGSVSAPPVPVGSLNNTTIWILAFAPIIGLFLEYVISGLFYGDNIFAQIRVVNGEFWYVTLLLNVLLCVLDEHYLDNAGYNTEKFKGWLWLVPVYIYQRYRTLGHGPAYFIVWCLSFALVVLGLV